MEILLQFRMAELAKEMNQLIDAAALLPPPSARVLEAEVTRLTRRARTFHARIKDGTRVLAVPGALQAFTLEIKDEMSTERELLATQIGWLKGKLLQRESSQSRESVLCTLLTSICRPKQVILSQGVEGAGRQLQL